MLSIIKKYFLFVILAQLIYFTHANAAYSCMTMPQTNWATTLKTHFTVNKDGFHCQVECDYYGSVGTNAYDAKNSELEVGPYMGYYLNLYDSNISDCDGKASCPSQIEITDDNTSIACQSSTTANISYNSNEIAATLVLDPTTGQFTSNSFSVKYDGHSGNGYLNMNLPVTPVYEYITYDDAGMLSLCEFDQSLDGESDCSYEKTKLQGSNEAAATPNNAIYDSVSDEYFTTISNSNENALFRCKGFNCHNIYTQLYDGDDVQLDTTDLKDGVAAIAVNTDQHTLYVASASSNGQVYSCNEESTSQDSNGNDIYSCQYLYKVDNHTHVILYDQNSSQLIVGTDNGKIYLCNTDKGCMKLGENSDSKEIEHLAVDDNNNVFASYYHSESNEGHVMVCNSSSGCFGVFDDDSHVQDAPLLSISPDKQKIAIAVKVKPYSEDKYYTNFYYCNDDDLSKNTNCQKNVLYNSDNGSGEITVKDISWLTQDPDQFLLATNKDGLLFCNVDASDDDGKLNCSDVAKSLNTRKVYTETNLDISN